MSRLPGAPPSDDLGEPALVERLRGEIAGEGPITFARFMQRALYEPALGYYASAGRPTRAGDFLTAPELHPIFGHAIARQLDEMWRQLGRPAGFRVREYGAATGTLGRAIADGLAADASPLAGRLVYEPVEFDSPAPADQVVGCILANEFIDALPVHRVVVDGGQLRELYVGWRDGRFAEVIGKLSDQRLEAWFAERGIALREGQRGEVNLAMLDWLAGMGADLERGYALVLDYGLSAGELYSDRRSAGTLRAFRSHHVGSDVLAGVGRQDLTAHVDLDMLERGAATAGLDVVGRTTLAELLIGCGLEDLMHDERARVNDDWDGQLLLRSAVRRLLDPRAYGGFAAVVLARSAPTSPPLRGLAFRLR